MKVLMITGDRRFGPGHERYELQKAAVEELAVVYWGRGSWCPKVPEGHFDVVTSQDPFWRGLFAWRVANKLGARFNVQVHADLSGQSFFKQILARMVLRNAGTIRVASEKIKQQVMQYNVHAKITVLPVYVDISKYIAIASQPHEGKIVLWIGRFEQEKQPLVALEVIQSVRAAGTEARLIMLGSGSLEHALKVGARGLPVEFPGWEDPAAYLARADVVLCTSTYESWGQSIVESLAAGVPVVAPDVGVAREAGAIVVSRPELGSAIINILSSGERGVLKFALLSKNEWINEWRATLQWQ